MYKHLYKHHSISALIGVRHYIVLICLLMFVVGSQNVSAQSQLAQDTYAIFEASCLNCHGTDGAYRETLLMEHNELIDGGTVIPGNPDASELYKRLLGPTENGVQMPFGQPQLPAQSIDTVRRWILAGAPEWSTTRITDGRFISPAEILDTIETHLNSLSSFDRAFARYFTLTHLYNAGESSEILREYRKALNKLVNSLSWGSTITNPQPIDPQATIYYIDLRHYEWDVNDGWTKIEAEYPYHIAFDAPTDTTLRSQLGRLQTQMKCDIPSVHIDWFIANASTPPLYHELLSLPLTDRDLETRLEVDVARNITNAPGVRVWRAGFNNSGVSTNNRVVERHTSRYGAYWKSYDFAGSVGKQNILTNPLSFTHDGGEAIFNLPNGLQGYYLVNASGFRLDDAPINIVSNPAASDPTVRNGISCIGCHTEGMKTFEDEVRSVIESNANPPYDKDQALRLYVEQSDMDARVSEDMETYRAALASTGGVFGGVEPVSRFHEAFHAPVDAAYAAAVVGLETDTFLEQVRENSGLQNVGLLALDNANGSLNRDTWTSSFRDVMYALDYPQQVAQPPVVEQPDVIPGTVVQIPDPNLRALIADTLDKSVNAPITVAEMKRLRNLDACRRRRDGSRDCDWGIRNLKGLEFAINLTRINMSHNQVTDISPVAGLIQLRELWLTDNLVSDISPVSGLTNLNILGVSECPNLSDISHVRNLTNLTRLDLVRTQVSDISHVRNLTNLVHLDFRHSLVSDISAVRRLINLVHLDFGDTLVSDLSPMAGLINLTVLGCWEANISDLSPLAKLDNLVHIDFRENHVSDLSPLVRLSNLERLIFTTNQVTDISPLSSMANLKHIRTWGNPFSDLSPLTRLTNLEVLDICGARLGNASLEPLTRLTSLKELYLAGNGITDISLIGRLTGLDRLGLNDNRISDLSPLAGLTKLKWLNLHANRLISDLSPLAGLNNLTWLDVSHNQISSLSPLNEIRNNNLKFVHAHGNPMLTAQSAPKIEGPWLWVFLPTTRHKLNEDVDLLTQASGGGVTELKIASEGATEGKAVGDQVWTSDKLPPTGIDNLDDMMGRKLPDGVMYGTIFLYSPRKQDTTMFLGADQEVKVWLNGEVIYQRERSGHAEDYTEQFSATIQQGKNVLLVAVATHPDDHSNLFIGLATDAEYSEATGIGYLFSESSIHIGDTFTIDIRAENVIDLAGWQFDIVFDRTRLEAVDVSEGDFLKTDGGSTFFQGGRIDNARGKITGLSAARLGDRGASGSGSLLQVEFKAKSTGETRLALQNSEFGSIIGDIISAGPTEIYVTVEERLATGDVNRDGRVSILDLILVARQLGQRVAADSPEDVNGDGVVNIFDLTLVAQGIGGAAAPPAPGIDSSLIKTWIAEARLVDDGSIAFRRGIANLQNLLASLMIPQETALHANYPNPFNPETWIPYQLAAPSEVTLTIYDMNGGVVRHLEVGHQPAGLYQSRSRAAYWDGRNGHGESVASGLYFYTLRTGEFTGTRKMLIRK